VRYSDKPINRPGEDALGRASFSLELARSIDGLIIAQQGFVIAVLGEWGSGKSSVVELALRFLTHLEMERASHTILLGDSNPVQQSLDQLEELATTFDKIRDRVTAYDSLNLNFPAAQRNYRLNLFQSWLRSDSDALNADRYWRLQQKIDERRRTIQVRFSPWLIAGRAELASALLSELGRALGDKLGTDVKKAFASILKRLAEFAPIAGAGLDLATGHGVGKLLTAGASWSASLAGSMVSGPTLDDLRENLKAALRALQNQRILVIVDDLDRLTPSEAVEMASLIKSLGDLPNVIYLLSYDESNLARLIQEGAKVEGRDFLRKIVQYAVHLPLPAGNDLAKLLDADLTTIIGELSPDDQERLGITWYFIFRHYLRTPRDVRLYVNSVAVALSAERDYVDIVDLLLLEIIRLYEPQLYNWIRSNLTEITQ
jgi:predicted KAP-like P-loop ATPase